MKKLKLLFAVAALLLGGNTAYSQSWTGNKPAEGTFFLYNVGAQKFINNGDPKENWGTNAYLQSGFGLDFQLEASGGAYKLDSKLTNGDSHYLATSLWCDAAATDWTFTAVEGQTNTYTIENGGSYLVATDKLDDIECKASTNDNKSWWKLVSLDDFKAAMQAKTYSATDPMDVSVFIQGRSFARNDGNRTGKWTIEHNGGNWTWIGGAENKYYGNESWNNTFSVSQTIENLPEGTYEVRCSGFGTNGTTYIFGNNTSKAIQTDNTTSHGNSKDAKWKAIHEDNAFAGQSTGTFTIGDGKLTLGVKRETNQSADWAIWDEFRLYYYGLDLSEFETTLNAAIQAAEAIEGTIPAAAYNQLAAIVTENHKTYTTAADYTTATNEIVAATATAKELQANTTRYNNVKSAALAVSPNVDTSTADSEFAAATTNEGIDAAIATLRAAFLAELPNVTIPQDPGYIDVTAVMVDNASVSTNTDYWTKEGTWNGVNSFGACAYGECEFYQHNFKFYQTINLISGTWEFGVTGFHRAGNHNTHFYAGEDQILIPGVESSVVNSMYEAQGYFNDGNGKVSLKFALENGQNIEIGIDNQDNSETDKWTIFRNFTLHYYGSAIDLSVYAEQWNTLLTNAGTAKTAHPSVTGSELTALNTAITDAPDGSSKDNYIEKINALDAAINTFNAAAPKYDAYVAYKTETEKLFGSDFNVAAPTSADEAATAVQNLNIAQYNKVTSDYKYSLSGLIGDFGSWTGTATIGKETPATPNYLDNEHWSGKPHAYYEQASAGWGNATGWTIKYEKTCTLPAGSYVIKVAARSSADVTSEIRCTATGTTISLPNEGAYTRGIDTSGKASWSNDDTFARGGEKNEGFGWQWRFLPFTLDAETEVTMTFYAETEKQFNWMSIADGELLSANNVATEVEYKDDISNVIKDVQIANVTIDRSIKADFNTVVLPFDLTANQVAAAFGTGTEVYEYSEYSTDINNITINFTKNDGSIKANTPVLIKATAESTSQTFNGVQVVAPTDAKVSGKYFDFVGIYTPDAIKAGDYFIGSGALYKSEGNTSIKAFRAYLKVKENVEARNISFVIDDKATAIEGIEIEGANDGKIYNLKGQEVKNPQKGVYIQNGKIIIIK